MLLNLNLKKNDDLQHITVFEQVANKIQSYTLDLLPHFLLKKFEFELIHQIFYFFLTLPSFENKN